MSDVDGTDFEWRATVIPPERKTLAWGRGSVGPAVATDIDMPALINFDARYREHSLLGEGGMGTVSLHEDRQIGRHVAVKRLLDIRRSPDEDRRFVREARIQAQLEHPAVVPVYDLGVDDDQQPWFSMKRVSGVTLAEVVDRLADNEQEHAQTWSRRRLLTALSQVCLAVDFAHQRGVLHRDLKPENVMLGSYGEVYVLDWGLAKQLVPKQKRPRSDAQGTSPGVVLGTPGFMAPEQIRGLSLSPAADVYALGAILFEILTLEPLYPVDEVPQMLRAALEGAEARPSIRAPERALPPELDLIVARAVDPDPGRRYPSARALHEAIETFLDGQRDLELRRKLAVEHAEEAARLLDSHEPGKRRQAMQAIGRALALDPEDPGATAILRGILTHAPKQRPPAVERALESSAAIQRGSAALVASFAYISMLLFLPLMLWAGIRDLAATLPFFIAMAVAGTISYFGQREGKVSARTVMIVMIVSNVGIACTTTIFGPLILLPASAAVNATAFAMTFTDWRRWTTGAAATLAVFVPLGLELGGVIGPSYEFGAGGMLVRPRAIELTQTSTIVFLAMASLGTIVIGTVTVARVRSALLRAEEKLHTYAWQVQQLLPEAARDDQAVAAEPSP